MVDGGERRTSAERRSGTLQLRACAWAIVGASAKINAIHTRGAELFEAPFFVRALKAGRCFDKLSTAGRRSNTPEIQPDVRGWRALREPADRDIGDPGFRPCADRLQRHAAA